MQEKIIEIIRIAVCAPSGENAQPWRFVVSGDTLSVFNLTDADTSLYNGGQRGSLVAHGALLEHISIAAKHHQLEANIELFPDGDLTDHIAKIAFRGGNPPEEITEELYRSIAQRVTNRKKYRDTPLTTKLREFFSHEGGGTTKLHLIEDAQKKATVARAASLNEGLLFEINSMHEFFFSHIRWTEEEERIDPRGFYVKTLELLPPQLVVMKLLRNPLCFRLFSMLGLSKLIASDNAMRYVSTGAMSAISAPGNTPRDFIAAGRMLARAWLAVTHAGWSMQPMSGILFLHQALKDDTALPFTTQQSKDIETAYHAMHRAFDISTNDQLLMLFRIGESDPPSARAKRVSPQIIIIS